MCKISIDKKLISNFPQELFDGNIFVVDDLEKLDEAIAYLNKCEIIGIDTETRPSFKKGIYHKVALIQLSDLNNCYLIRLNKIGFPKSLADFLENQIIMKVGLSLNDDIARLEKLIKFKPGNFVDLQSFVKNYGIVDNGLSRIYAILFEKRIAKGQQLSNWEAQELTSSQQLYGATDAWACLKIYNYLLADNFNPSESKYILKEDDEI